MAAVVRVQSFHDEFLFNGHCGHKRVTSWSPASTTITEAPTVGSKMLVAIMVATSQPGRRVSTRRGRPSRPVGRRSHHIHTPVTGDVTRITHVTNHRILD